MIRPLLVSGITLFWLSSMGQLVSREFFSMTPVRSPYEVLTVQGTSLREEYRGIYLGGNLIGFTNTALEQASSDKEDTSAKSSPIKASQPLEKTKETAKTPDGFDLTEDSAGAGKQNPVETGGFELRQNTYMTFLFLGTEREMLVRSKALLNDRLELKAFEVKMTSGGYSTDIKGRTRSSQIELIIESKGSAPIKKTLDIQQPLFFSESLPMLWTPENLKPGKRGSLRVWNPLLLSVSAIEFRVSSKQRIDFGSENIEAYVVTLSENGVETRYWCTPEGVVLKYESPTGLLMVKQDAWKIFDALREKRKALTDLPNLYSIPSNITLQNPEKITELSVRVKTPEKEEEMTLRRESLDDLLQAQRGSFTSPDFQPYLGSTEYIQSDAAGIKRLAEEWAGPDNTVLGSAQRLLEGVHQWMTPTPTVSIPSALQVLEMKKGDCNEYTVLFTALARALGIPTKTVAGLVYRDGRFFYHAWPEIYAGRWIGVDPTFLQIPVDATHVPLVEGSLEEQTNLIQKIGKISIEILRAKGSEKKEPQEQ